MDLASIRSTLEEGLDSGLVNVVLQVNAKKARHIQCPERYRLCKTQEAKQLIDTGIHANSAILRAYALPPGTPKERLSVLRRFHGHDERQRFRSGDHKSESELNPLSGVEVESIARKLYQVDSNLAGKLKEILVPKIDHGISTELLGASTCHHFQRIL